MSLGQQRLLYHFLIFKECYFLTCAQLLSALIIILVRKYIFLNYIFLFSCQSSTSGWMPNIWNSNVLLNDEVVLI